MVALLLAVAAPLVTINLGLAGVSTLPEDTESRRAFETLDNDFSAGLISPAEIVVDAEDVGSQPVQRGIEDLLAALDEDEMFSAATVETNEEQSMSSS